jgi:ankyrin repeat protein
MRLTMGSLPAIRAWNEVIHAQDSARAARLVRWGMIPPETHYGDMLQDLFYRACGETQVASDVPLALLAMGANPNTVERNNRYEAPIHLAARRGLVGLFEGMLAAGGDVNLRNGLKETPALCAAALVTGVSHAASYDAEGVRAVRERGWAIVSMCLAAGADTQTTAAEALVEAALSESIERLDWLRTQPGIRFAAPEAQSVLESLFIDRLPYAQRPDFWPVIDALVSWGARLEARDSQGFTPVHRALQRGRLKLEDIEPLTERGVNWSAVTAEGDTFTHLLLTHQGHANNTGWALYQALRQAGLPDQLDQRNRAGQTPQDAMGATCGDWTVQQVNLFSARLNSLAQAKAIVQQGQAVSPRSVSPVPRPRS